MASSPSGQTAEELMSAYVEGDVDAFDELSALLEGPLHKFFTSRIDAAEADNLVHQTLSQIRRTRLTYRSGAPVRPWVFTVAARVASERDRAQAPAATPQPRKARPGTLVERLCLALRGLQESQRLELLHRFEGLSFDEMGEMLSSSSGPPS